MSNDEVYLSASVAAELTDLFRRLPRKLTNEQIVFLEQKMRDLISMAKLVTVKAVVSLSRDAKDDHDLSLCKEVKADFLITGDTWLLVTTLTLY